MTPKEDAVGWGAKGHISWGTRENRPKSASARFDLGGQISQSPIAVLRSLRSLRSRCVKSSSTRRRPTITYLPITLPKGLIMVAIKSLDAYVGWTVAQGIQTPLELRSTRDGQYRYATASQPIAPEDTILRVPLASCLTAENLEALAERLKYESDAGARSKFEPYINMLPSFEQLHVLPRFWEGNLVETVTDGGQLESRIRRDKNDNLDPWALACVDSRANFIQDGFSMTPFLDM